MNKLGIIIKREYLTRVKKKSFLLITFLGPLFFVALMIAPTLLALNSDKMESKKRLPYLTKLVGFTANLLIQRQTPSSIMTQTKISTV